MNAFRCFALVILFIALAVSVQPSASAQVGPHDSTSAADTAEPSQRPLLIELFTSQGCYSCPPADDLLRELGQYDQLIPLSFHVDYWNHLGWQDPYSHADWSQRQRRYARLLRSDTVYTPQLVIDGHVDEVGSDRMEVLNKIADRLDANRRSVPTTITLTAQVWDQTIVVKASAEPELGKNDQLYIALYERHLETEIPSGENRNKTLHYDYVVRRLVPHQGGRSTTLELDPAWQLNHLGVVAFVQNTRSGQVLGVARAKEPLAKAR